jgi:uncharacterized protein
MASGDQPEGVLARLIRVSMLAVALTVVVTPSPTLAQSETLASLPFAKKAKLAKAGDNDARFAVGEALEKGIEVKVDLFQAARWYREAALAGHVEAQYRLARLLRVGAVGLPQDKIAAIKLFEDAAAKGHPGSTYAIGVAYQLGDGVIKDLARAKAQYETAAKLNHPAAHNSLGLLYLKGEGVPQDFKLAIENLERAVSANDVWGMNNLAAMYEQGWGIAPDIIKAKALYAQASALGLATATKNLSRLNSTTGTTTPAPVAETTP